MRHSTTGALAPDVQRSLRVVKVGVGRLDRNVDIADA
jgi:hypothetical protein